MARKDHGRKINYPEPDKEMAEIADEDLPVDEIDDTDDPDTSDPDGDEDDV